MNTPAYPTEWQKKTMWSALAALSVVVVGAIAVGLIWVISNVLSFLQPILIPFAVAGVMAYLLDPVVTRISHWGTSRQRAVLSVFAVMTIAIVGILVWILPTAWNQTVKLTRKIPEYRQKTVQKFEAFNEWAQSFEKKVGLRLLPPLPPAPEPLPESAAPATASPAAPAPANASATATPGAPASTATNPADAVVHETPANYLQEFLRGDSLQKSLPVVVRSVWRFILNSVGGFLGAFGFLLSMVIVPIYLFYFLIESKNIASSWGDYLPLRASAFKDEVVSALSEINGYLIAFFRGQLLVSVINGTATGLGLVIVGLDFGLLIGLLLCFLGIIPYLGIVLCWIPAVIIASVQGGSWLIPATAPWWVLPVVVTAIFTVVQQIDGLFITPKIVGESVGLHPVTVIVSVFAWSLLMGGLLGAILAVPMTATIKVLLKRYVWQRKLMADAQLTNVETSLTAAEPPPGVPAAALPAK